MSEPTPLEIQDRIRAARRFLYAAFASIIAGFLWYAAGLPLP